MPRLKSNVILSYFCIFILGCQTIPTFSIETHQSQADSLHTIIVASNRVTQKCLFLNAEAENNWRHQYFIYVLNDKNEVFEIMQPTHLDKETCESQRRAIDNILRTSRQVKMCVHDELIRVPKNANEKSEPVAFGPFGDHTIPYEALTFDSICNSKKCIGNNEAWVSTCPGFIKH